MHLQQRLPRKHTHCPQAPQFRRPCSSNNSVLLVAADWKLHPQSVTMLRSRLSLLITGHLAHIFGHPLSIITVVRCHNAGIQEIRTKSLSCVNRLPLPFADNRQIQDSGSGLFANAQNILITGGTFVVCLSCGLYKRLIMIYLPEQCQ